MGTRTAFVNPHPLISLNVLRRLPGANNEHNNVRKHSLNYLIDVMQKANKLPLNSSHNEMLPHVVVAYDGSAWINEGNHRIRAADHLGWESMRVELVYFDGGELVKSGELYPPKIGLYEEIM